MWREVAFAPIAPAFLREINRAIIDWKPDYLHLHLPNLSALAVLLSQRARRLPWVIHWHSDVVSSEHSLPLRVLYPFYRPFERALLQRASLVICTSRQYLETSEPLQPYREKCVVVPLGMDLSRMSVDQTDSAPCVNWGDGNFRLLAVGRLTYYKGFDTLIKAVAQCDEVELRIVGDGTDRGALQALVERLNVTDRVFLEGGLEDPACLARYQSAELFCIPSRERTEAFGLVALEAMAHRLPVLASALTGSGLVEVVQHEKSGRLVPVDDVAAWRDAIEFMRATPQQAVTFGQAGYERVHQRFAIATVEQRLRATLLPWLFPKAHVPAPGQRPLVVIPAQNESLTIAAVVAGVIAAGFVNVLVVDDASSDNTGAIARASGAMVLRAPLVQGAWGAMQTGIRFAVRHHFSSVITMDADGQHHSEELRILLAAAERADVIIGACTARGSASRKFAWSLFRSITGFSVEDLTSGFRLYNAAACRVLASAEATLLDHQDIGVLLLLRKSGLTFAEVQVQMSVRTAGMSRVFRNWRSVISYMIQTLVLAFARRQYRR